MSTHNVTAYHVAPVDLFFVREYSIGMGVCCQPAAIVRFFLGYHWQKFSFSVLLLNHVLHIQLFQNVQLSFSAIS